MILKKIQKTHLVKFTSLIYSIFLFAHITPQKVFAQCYDYENATSVGAYLECMLPSLWTATSLAFAGIALILIIYLVFKTVTAYGGANAQSLQEMPMKWAYLLLFVLLAIGVGGTIINIVLPWLGFPGMLYWTGAFQEFLNELK
jgi:hypothetical protein